MGACPPCRRAQPEVCKERGLACASFLCLGTFFPGYAWTNKPCLLNPANSDLSCILPCFRAQFWVCLPAQAHPERDSAFCQLLVLSGESWPRTQRKGVEEWGLEPGSQPSTLCLWLKAWTTTKTERLFFYQRKLCHCRLAVAFLACWKRMFCQAASLTPSVLHEARKESPLRPLSWCSAANAVLAILADSSLGNFPDPHLKEEFPEQNLRLVARTWPLPWTKASGRGLISHWLISSRLLTCDIHWITYMCFDLKLFLHQLAFLPERIYIFVFFIRF